MSSLPLTHAQILALKPTYRSRFTHQPHSKGLEVETSVQAYLAEKWPWFSDAAQEKYIHSGIDLYVNYAMPAAKDAFLEPANLWMALYFLIDDLMEEVSEKGQRVARIFPLTLGTTKPKEGDAFEEVIYDIHRRCREAGDQADLEAFQNMSHTNIKWMEYVLKKRREAALAPPKFDNFEDFCKHRVIDVGSFVLCPFLRWICRLHIPENVLNHPDVRAMETTTTQHAMYINELYSLRKELKEDEENERKGVKVSCPNTILFLAEKDGISVEQAMENLLSKLPGLEKDLLDFQEKAVASIRKGFGAAMGQMVESYGEILKAFIPGNIAWHANVGRYNDLSL